MKFSISTFIYFFDRERAVSWESCNLIGSGSGQYFPISWPTVMVTNYAKRRVKLRLLKTLKWLILHFPSLLTPVSDICRLQTADCRLPTADYRLQTANCGTQTVGWNYDSLTTWRTIWVCVDSVTLKCRGRWRWPRKAYFMLHSIVLL